MTYQLAHPRVCISTHRLLEVKHLYKKVENQIKMAKMILMNEINKRTNILLEQLEVSKARFSDT